MIKSERRALPSSEDLATESDHRHRWIYQAVRSSEQRRLPG